MCRRRGAVLPDPKRADANHLPLAAVLGLSYSAMLPAWNALLSYYVPANQEGVGWGVLNTVEGIGVAIGPSSGGAIGSLMTVSAPIEIAAAVFLFIGIFYLFVPIKGLSSNERRA